MSSTPDKAAKSAAIPETDKPGSTIQTSSTSSSKQGTPMASKIPRLFTKTPAPRYAAIILNNGATKQEATETANKIGKEQRFGAEEAGAKDEGSGSQNVVPKQQGSGQGKKPIKQEGSGTENKETKMGAVGTPKKPTVQDGSGPAKKPAKLLALEAPSIPGPGLTPKKPVRLAMPLSSPQTSRRVGTASKPPRQMDRIAVVRQGANAVAKFAGIPQQQTAREAPQPSTSAAGWTAEISAKLSVELERTKVDKKAALSEVAALTKKVEDLERKNAELIVDQEKKAAEIDQLNLKVKAEEKKVLTGEQRVRKLLAENDIYKNQFAELKRAHLDGTSSAVNGIDKMVLDLNKANKDAATYLKLYQENAKEVDDLKAELVAVQKKLEKHSMCEEELKKKVMKIELLEEAAKNRGAGRRDEKFLQFAAEY